MDNPNSEARARFFLIFLRHWEAGSGLGAARAGVGQWTPRAFANAMGKAGISTLDPATIDDWLAGRRFPQRLRKDAMLRVFFPGSDSPNSDEDAARREFDLAWKEAQPRAATASADVESPWEWVMSMTNELPGMVELHLHQPRWFNDLARFYLDVSLRVDAAVFEWDDKDVTIGVRELFLTLDSTTYQAERGSLLGERPSHQDTFRRRAGGVAIVGPLNEDGCLEGNLLDGEYVAALVPISDEDDEAVSVQLHVGRRSFVVTQMHASSVSEGSQSIPELTPEKDAIVNIIINKCLRKDHQGRPIVATSTMRRKQAR